MLVTEVQKHCNDCGLEAHTQEPTKQPVLLFCCQERIIQYNTPSPLAPLGYARPQTANGLRGQSRWRLEQPLVLKQEQGNAHVLCHGSCVTAESISTFSSHQKAPLLLTWWCV